MVRKTIAAAVLVALATACHTITEELPTSTTKTPTSAPAPIPVIVVPIPVLTPTPAPAATPTPGAPAPGGNPTPAPPAPPSGSTCGIGPGNGSGNNCPLEHPTFLSDVEAALDQVTSQHPELFNLKDTRGGCENCYFIKNTDAYWAAVTAAVQARGLCATNDGEELAVKNTNGFNDQYDIVTGDGYIRRQLGSYRSTCHPAWF